jgi:hypothetical protein
VSDLYDREGNPISIEQWRLLFEDKRYQILKQTQIGTLQVSTIWLGIDHGFGHTAEPLIFETMIFGSEEEEQWRYASEQEALAHHDQLCEQIRLLETVG